MPNLPTISVTDAQSAKLIELFGSVAEYKTWLKNAVRSEAIRRQATAAIQQVEADIPPVA